MNLSRTLLESLASGNLPATRLILENSPDRARSDVWVAAFCGEAEALQAALHADPDLLDRPHPELGWTPLFCCAASRMHRTSERRSQGILACAANLLDRGAVLDGPETDEGLPRLQLAEEPAFGALEAAIALGDHPALVDLLIASRAPVSQRALGHAAQLPRTHCMCSLLSAEPELATSRILHHQLFHEDPQGLRLLLENGADPNFGIGTLGTALHTAIREERSEDALHLLLRYGVDLEAHDQFGLTPLRLAVRQGLVDVADLLISRGADPHTTSFDRVLDYCFRGMPEVALRVLSDSPELCEDVTNDSGEAFARAVAKSRPEAVSALLEVGFDPEVTLHGQGMLQLASAEGNVTLLALLLDADLHVNGRDDRGERALDAAVHGLEHAHGRDDDYSICIQMLLEAGADPHGILHERSSLLAVELIQPHLAG
ncbi:MAG: ankyrin repeat domain-containing protein [Planctomycetota bacterium]